MQIMMRVAIVTEYADWRFLESSLSRVYYFLVLADGNFIRTGWKGGEMPGLVTVSHNRDRSVEPWDRASMC
jgi:hypothetical protein